MAIDSDTAQQAPRQAPKDDLDYTDFLAGDRLTDSNREPTRSCDLPKAGRLSSSSRKAGSRSTRAWIVSLKSRVRAIALCFLSLALFVLPPQGLSSLDILLLALLGAAAEQDDVGVSVLAEIDPVFDT